MKTIEFIGKKRAFKRVKMAQLMDMQLDMQTAVNNATDSKEQFLAMGKIVSNFLEPFEPEEMLDAEPDEFYLAQGLHIIATLAKHNKPKKEIDDMKMKIIDASIEMQLNSMINGGQSSFQ